MPVFGMARRGYRDGRIMRRVHEMTDKTILRGDALLKLAIEWNYHDFIEHFFSDSHSTTYLESFITGYTESEGQPKE